MTDPARPGAEAPTLLQSIAVEVAFGVIGIVVVLATGRSLGDALASPQPPLLAVGVGLVTGALLGAVFGFGLTRPAFAERVRPFLSRFTSAPPTPAIFAALGLAAALGEETLFRAAIQPVAGMVVASLLFMLAHSLIADFRHPTAGKAAYPLLAFGMGVVLGLLYERLGIAAAIAAHFAFDTVALILVAPLLPRRVPVAAAARWKEVARTPPAL